MERRISYYPKCKIISYFHGHLAKIQQWAPAQYTAEIKIIFFHPATRKKIRGKSQNPEETHKNRQTFSGIFHNLAVSECKRTPPKLPLPSYP